MRLAILISLFSLFLSSCASKISYNNKYNSQFETVEKEDANLNEYAVEEVEVKDRVLFPFDKYYLTKEAKSIADDQIMWLKDDVLINILIEGHCDDRGTREYNISLGEKRANALKSYMVSNGIDQKRISTISYGKERPEVTGYGEQYWSKNRRAVVVVK